MLSVEELSVELGGVHVLKNVSFSAQKGRWLMIVGPNGAGKSTIVNAVAQGLPYEGKILYDGVDLRRQRPADIAKKIGILSQKHNVGYDFTVSEVVALGRYAHSKGVLRGRSDDDDKKIEAALELTGLSELRNQSVLTLSGGELQRTFLAQVFAQDPELLILDEPANHLDLVYQKQIFELIRSWMGERGRTVISVVHDLSMARLYGTEALLLDRGVVKASGDINCVLSDTNLTCVYKMNIREHMTSLLKQWE